jgi:protease-4
VRAVVLHVNSPGGSALASDLLWREVVKLAAEKPVIAAFEDVSASGGYYLAAPAAEIIARPSTLTGSIGVFGGKLVVGEGLRKLGVFNQPITAGPNAVLFSPARPFTPDQRKRFKASLQRFYDGFVERVATGRKKEPAEIEQHCRGRVWTGEAALQRGLVDRAGDLPVAVERARALAGLTDYRVLTWSSRRHGLAARALGGVLRRVRPIGAEMLLDQLPTSTAALVLKSQGEPLALLPWGLNG